MTITTRYTLALAAFAVAGAVSVGTGSVGTVSAFEQADAPGLRPAPGPTSSTMPAALQNVRFEQKLDATLPLDAVFRDEQGAAVKLGDYFGTRPVVVAFVYYECPMLCNQILNGLVSSVGVLD